jgi:hypothetical protein
LSRGSGTAKNIISSALAVGLPACGNQAKQQADVDAQLPNHMTAQTFRVHNVILQELHTIAPAKSRICNFVHN